LIVDFDSITGIPMAKNINDLTKCKLVAPLKSQKRNTGVKICFDQKYWT